MGSIPPWRTNRFQEDTCHSVCILFVVSGLGCLLVARFAASLIHMMASRGPSSAQNGPAATLVCHPECAPARSLAQGEAHAASAPHGLGNLRALPFSWSCKTPSSASWEEWTPTADVRGMMHFGDRSQPLSVLPGQRANSARPDPRRECPSGTAAWRTRAGHQSPRAGVASRSRGARPASVPRRGRPHSSALQSHAYSPRPEGRPPLRPIPAPAHPATCPLPNHLLPDIGNKTR